ncbi:hypothetical protein G8E10_09655 [Rhizobiaceae bacterium CRRU44]|uniref:Uncharacterized protein n=1 Tax=Ferranicluibacter rubi TaxID=2715133 RepID=A0AA43ZDP0_9HYPH|nr:hypothetical protein [Ferranicluibacter rubi]NHT75939.1 hypothetical protein [Ferranicluibacter rubi]NHT75999.1 hypothetical protein [Ferranicluibacter rubi]
MIAVTDDRIMVAVTFHYRHDRLEHLYQTIRSIAHYPVQEVTFHIYTNSADASQHQAIHELLSELTEVFPGAGNTSRTIEIHTVEGLDNPQHLTWAHKPLIREFIGSCYTHFIYTEDDHEITYANFLYFRTYRNILAPHGLYPGFQRIELNKSDMVLHSTDQVGPSRVIPRAKIDMGEFIFMTMDNPYYGFFILDQHLAGEYVTNRAFDMESSKESFGWEVCERSAMALTFENVPDGFWVRPVVPVTKGHRIASVACVRHLPNNYANNPSSPLGSMRMSDVIKD